MKNILLMVHDDDGQEARLQAALDAVRAIDGHLTCVDVIQTPQLIGDYYTTYGGVTLLADELDHEAAHREAIEQRLVHEDVRWSWARSGADMAEGVVRASAFADLIVLNRRLETSGLPDMQKIVDLVLLQAHKPVLAVPEGLKRFDIGGRALVAWDGSYPALATMRACVPLLKLAADVRLFSVDNGSHKTSAEAAAEYLSRHGIFANVRHIFDNTHNVDELIVEECVNWGASWCLMGAYGHSHLAERLFGGVTRRMLAASRIPLVLGH